MHLINQYIYIHISNISFQIQSPNLDSGDEGSLRVDRDTYQHMFQDIVSIKTTLLKLKRVLQQVYWTYIERIDTISLYLWILLIRNTQYFRLFHIICVSVCFCINMHSFIFFFSLLSSTMILSSSQKRTVWRGYVFYCTFYFDIISFFRITLAGYIFIIVLCYYSILLLNDLEYNCIFIIIKYWITYNLYYIHR